MSFTLCGRPSGSLIFVPMIFTTIAFILSNRANRWCDYVKRDINSVSGSDVGSLDTATEEDIIFMVPRGMGAYGYEDATDGWTCYSWPSDVDFDSKWRSMKAFSVCTTIIGGMCMLVTFFTSCMGVRPNIWRLVGAGLLICTLFEGLTFLGFSSDLCGDYTSSNGEATVEADCSLAVGSRCGIAATIFWFLSSVCVCKMPPPEAPEPVIINKTVTTTRKRKNDGTLEVETKTETKNPDGTVEVETKTETKNPDGTVEAESKMEIVAMD